MDKKPKVPIRWNLLIILAMSMAFGAFALNQVFGLLTQFEFNGQVDANAIAVAMVGIIGMIIGYVLGTKQTAAQATTEREPDPPPPPTMTEDGAITMARIARGEDVNDGN